MSGKALVVWIVVLLVLGGGFYWYRNYGSKQQMAPVTQTTKQVAQKTEAMVKKEPAVEVKLDSVTGSPVKQTGTATLTEENGKVKVVVALSGDKAAGPQPMHVHTGTCAKPGAVVYPLTNVVDGKSETTLGVDMKTLMSTGTLINVHKSASELGVYTACGEFPHDAMMQEGTPSASGTPAASPSGAMQK